MRAVTLIDVDEWDELVKDTYGKPYSFQQQDGCKERQVVNLSVPDTAYDFDNDSVPEEVNHEEMGVSFKSWLARDPKQKLSNPEDQEEWCVDLWWGRNFYPDVQMVANDLNDKGILPSGEYIINIDW